MDSTVVSAPGTARATASHRSRTRDPHPLIGDFIRRPEWLWLTQVAPITSLLAWMEYTRAAIPGELSPVQHAESAALATALIAIATGAGLYALRHQQARRLFTNGECVGMLVMSLGVLTSSVIFTLSVIPNMELGEITGRRELLFEALCLGMPGAFHALLILSAHTPPRKRAVEFSVLLLAIALGGVLFREFSSRVMPITCALHFPGETMAVLMLAAAFGGGMATTALVMRATLIAYTSIRRMHPLLQRGFMFLVAGAGPIAGLRLNCTIPFPVDLQSPSIYHLALLDGGMLLLPVVRSIFWHRVIWLSQCALFPFSAYFFFIFLPCLPLSLLAMTIYGAGFLMLVPLVLGIIHASRIADGFREEVRDGPRWPVAAMGLAALLALPALGLWSALQDRASLDTAPAHLPSSGQGEPLEAGDGKFLPFLTPLYHEIVFHDRAARAPNNPDRPRTR